MSRWGGGTLIAEVDVVNQDKVVNFVNVPITFPTNVTSTYSGLGVRFTITFQAIQNYIPDDEGNKVENTIDNSYKIFDYFEQRKYEPTPLSYFAITVDAKGNNVLSVAEGVTLPENLVLPSADANGNPITHISGDLLNGNTTVKNVVIPSSYTSISGGAFANSAIESIDMSQSSITSLPNYTFHNCTSLKNVKLNEGLTTLNFYTFANCSSLKSLTLPESMTTINSSALVGVNLNALYIPANVSYIADGGLFRCSVLMKIIVDEDNEYYYDVDNVMLCGYDGLLVNLVSAYDGSSVTIPEGIKSMCRTAMLNSTNVTNVNYPSTIETINHFPPNMTSFTISEDNPYIISPTGHEMIYTSNGELFKFCIGDLVDYTMPNECIIVKDRVFVGTELNSLTIGANVATVTGLSFSEMKVSEIYVDNANTHMYTDNNVALISNDGIFCLYSYTATNTEYTVPLGVTIVGYKAFYDNQNLCKLTLQEGVTTLATGGESYGLQYCRNLSYLRLPSTLTSVGRAIHVYTGLVQAGSVVIFDGATPPTFVNNKFSCSGKIYVPDSAVDIYKATEPFSNISDRIYPISEYVEE